MDGASFDRGEDEVFNKQANQDHKKQAGKYVRGLQLVAVFKDVPAQTTAARGHAKHQLCGNQRTPCKSPPHLETGQDAWESRWNQDRNKQGKPMKNIVMH